MSYKRKAFKQAIERINLKTASSSLIRSNYNTEELSFGMGRTAYTPDCYVELVPILEEAEK
ncbi:hypothetical protein RO3G_08149 [Rhizopus delemar RA 99-880]|uniref:Uncharacterized protein n=1 Tax=Rhizopus delemar (strain RA 99-880 / ATCC MYA-4621 / FGSC 9543 / NRRL 43880) TaxID=246409 RepID=I1C4R4_RHIO9|nr:hypothetical protein RO3G_08149 [Rhizopus delemar RA 99-880]|eukprot:EIE83444.1 hypothetical protein RO3G_08149 [Rhizopus delemar RA 99-880]